MGIYSVVRNIHEKYLIFKAYQVAVFDNKAQHYQSNLSNDYSETICASLFVKMRSLS